MLCFSLLTYYLGFNSGLRSEVGSSDYPEQQSHAHLLGVNKSYDHVGLCQEIINIRMAAPGVSLLYACAKHTSVSLGFEG